MAVAARLALPWLVFAGALPAAAVEPSAPRDDVPALARTLETLALDLFKSLTRDRPPASESVLLHAHNLLGAARSFALLSAEQGADREFLELSFSLLREEAKLLEPLLPDAQHEAGWPEVLRTLDGIQAALGGLPPEGIPGASPPETDPDRPGVELVSDGWHGSLLDRFVRLKGKLSGVSLSRCDVIVTDARNRVVWTAQDHVSEVTDYYRTKPWARGRSAGIRFSIRLPASRLTAGTNFVTFRLVDEAGRQAFATVVVGK